MVGVVKLFGLLNVIVGIIFLIGSLFFSALWVGLLPLGASALLGGALLMVFARIVELLEEMNSKLTPVTALANRLDAQYSQGTAAAGVSVSQDAAAAAGVSQGTAAVGTRQSSDYELLWNPPADADRFYYKARVATKLADGTVIGQTATDQTGEVRRFASVKEYQDFIDR